MALVISNVIKQKLSDKHNIFAHEIEQCFANYHGIFLLDTREEHKTVPPTKWFIGETDYGKLVKVCFILEAGNVYIRTAYEPNETEVKLFNKLTK